MCKPAPPIAVRHRRLVADRRGATALVLALIMPVLVGSTALALEVGSWSITKTYLQRRADMAAYAATLRYQLGDSAQTATNVGIQVAALNGATASSPTWNAGTNTTTASDVTVALVSGVRTSSDPAMKAVVTTSVPLSIGKYFTTSTAVTVSATAYAEITTSNSGGGNGQPCAVALNKNGAGITIQGGTTVSTPSCDLRSNASLSVTNGSTVDTLWAYAAGAVTVSGGSEITNGTSTVTPTNVGTWTNAAPLYENAGQMADPYAGDTAIQNDFAALNAGQGTVSNIGNGANTSIQAGTYSSITIGGGATVSMGAGTYFVNGNVNIANGATVTGSGVTIVTSGTVTFGGGATVTLSAPLSGATSGIPGILIAGNSTGTDTLSNGMMPTLTGVIYYPNGTMAIAGGVHTGNSCLELIASSISISNGAGFGASCSNYGAATFAPLAGTQSTALVQ